MGTRTKDRDLSFLSTLQPASYFFEKRNANQRTNSKHTANTFKNGGANK